MRLPGLLMVALLFGAPGLAAQTALAAPVDARLLPPAAHFAAVDSGKVRRDHVSGALQGAVLGAVVGGLGFAAVTYIGNAGDSEGQGYALLAIPVGGVVGGAIGLVVGGIIGAPERDLNARLFVAPNADRGVTAAASVPIGPRRR